MNFSTKYYALNLIGSYLKKHVKIALFSYTEIFLMAFFMLFYFNLF